MHPAIELLAGHELARGIARVREQERGEASTKDFAAKILRGEAVAAIALEEDRNAREGLEDVEELLVGRVVGQEVSEIDAPEARCCPRERRSTAAGDAHVLRRVLRSHALA